MEALTVCIEPLSAFGTPLAGDTLFGQLCWALRERHGEARLRSALKGYTTGSPFMVVSDGFPAGFLPRPSIPDSVVGLEVDPKIRKDLRAARWLPVAEIARPLREWLVSATKAGDAEVELVTQNTINRLTGTTGKEQFAPRQVERLVFPRGGLLELHAAVDTERMSVGDFVELLADVGGAGYGRDASAGTGKFRVVSHAQTQWADRTSRRFLALAPCAPVPESLVASECYYQPLTRFGRHGNIAVHLGQPFKRPALMMRTGAVLSLREESRVAYHGIGLGGLARPVSAVMPETVYQGYAPLVPLNLDIPA